MNFCNYYPIKTRESFVLWQHGSNIATTDVTVEAGSSSVGVVKAVALVWLRF